MRSAPIEIGVFNLRSLEITSRSQAIQHLVPLLTRDSPSKLLLSTAIEYRQLEVGTEQLILYSSRANLQ